MSETLRISIGCASLTIIMICVFAFLGKFDVFVLFGSLAGNILAIGNFYIMGLFLQKAMNAKENNVSSIVRLSYSGRMIAIFLIVIALIFFKAVNPVAVILPLFYPRVTIFVLHVLLKKTLGEETNE